MEVLINNELSNFQVLPVDVKKFVEFCLIYENVSQNTEVSISFVSKNKIQDLNKLYRKIDKPTDVLSFECDNPNLDKIDNTCVLGDVVICPEICNEQCGVYGNTLQEELTLLLCHGILHLLGYDHIEEADAFVMQAKEKEIIDAWSKQ